MTLPSEMLDQVLIRLPVKHLLRCRCVSKGWCSLIDSAPFGKKHLKRTIEYNAGGGSLVINGGGGKFYLADFKAMNGGGDDDATAVEIDDPLKTLLTGTSVVGAANGLVCVHKKMMTELLIFNPATRESRKIPSAPREFPRSFQWNESSLCGFGYDHLNDDYKIVKIAECYLQFRGIMFKDILIPAMVGPVVSFSTRCVDSDGESLCILDNYPDSRTDVWLMNNSGAENPWSKPFSVDNSKLVWYDLGRKMIENVMIHGIPNKFGSHVYTESLVKLTEDKLLQNPSEDKPEKKKQKRRDDFLSRGFKLRL
ncbi:hypothetical protein POM88_007020 [Heracleum sosnowskyi]|uniref:F-box domain-containing protein n=1 Tax=Heracleum sosnowskyi TaxID=360622 RepID=A0AAD8N5V5_9APIA|nr:hypothetical protein POM88_007020 [Heracleum sosnowskyi]